jgi:hypothetical protein
METLRKKFTIVCSGCDGTGMFEEIYTTFGNEVKYRDVVCGCENGKELDWQKINSEIKATEKKISTCKMRDTIYNEVLREIYDKHLLNCLPDAVKQLIENERELLKLENYLSELETIE